MTYNLLVSGYRKTIDYLTFEPSTAKIKVLSQTPAPSNASWVEQSVTHKNVVYSLSEEPDSGLVVSLIVEGTRTRITSERKTDLCAAHIHCMKDGSGIVVSHYLGGSVAFFPVDPATGEISQTSSSPYLAFPYPYKDTKPPNPERQDTAHAHQVIEGDDGVLYSCDLGGDRVWVLEREGESELVIKGYLQCPAGSGPRHAALSPDKKHLYVLTELHHSLFTFSLNNPTYPVHPIPDVEINIVPPNIPQEYQFYVDSAEISLHPHIPNVVYASNRWELHINEKNEKLPPFKPDTPSTGDAVAIILLSADGSKIESLKHVRTGCDTIRGMQVSPDGKYVMVAGQEGGGVEIWQIGGERGDDWKLAAKDEEIQKVTDIAWL